MAPALLALPRLCEAVAPLTHAPCDAHRGPAYTSDNAISHVSVNPKIQNGRRTSALGRTTDSSRTSSHVRQGPTGDSGELPPTEAALLLGERMFEEKTKHFLCCVRSSRISVGARRAASGPCVSGSVDIPVLQHSASTRIYQDRSGISMPSGYLPVMHLPLCAYRSHGLLKN